MQTKLISVVIVTYNSCSVISECLESIQQYNDIEDKLEVVIVDNSPHSNISKVIDSLTLKLDIRYIHNPENGGFGQGNNIGAKDAVGELLFILNPDTILVEPIFKFMIKEFENKKLTVAGFRLIDRNGNDNDMLGLLPEYNYIYISKKILNFIVIKFGLLSKYVFPWGADLIVRRKDFINAGMFDESIFLCNEEPDLVKRLKIDKIKIFSKKIIHLEGHTTEVQEVRFREQLKSTCYYFKKYKKNYKLYIAFFVIRTTLRKILNLSLFTEFKSNRSIYQILFDEYRKK